MKLRKEKERKGRKETCNCLEYSARTLGLASDSLSRNRNRFNPKRRSQRERQRKESVATAERESWTTTWKGLWWSSSQSEHERAKCDATGTAIAKTKKTMQESEARYGFEWFIIQIHFKNDSNLLSSAASNSDSGSDFCESIWGWDFFSSVSMASLWTEEREIVVLQRGEN